MVAAALKLLKKLTLKDGRMVWVCVFLMKKRFAEIPFIFLTTLISYNIQSLLEYKSIIEKSNI